MKGRFKPINPKKYIGDPTNIIYRSSWELKLMAYIDKHPEIHRWSSEEISIPYRSPIDGKIHRYFPDFFIEKIIDGKFYRSLIEVKPFKETKAPELSKTKTGKISKRYLIEVQNWGKNQAKWEAAEAYCKSRGWFFQTMTEKQLGIK